MAQMLAGVDRGGFASIRFAALVRDRRRREHVLDGRALARLRSETLSLIEAIQASDELDEWSRAYLLGLARKILDALIMYRFRGVEPLIDVSAVVHGSVEKNPNRTRFTDTHAFKVFGAVLLTLDTTLSIATGIKELVGGETGRSVPAVIEQRVQPAEPSPPDLIPLPIDAEVVGADPD